MSKLLRRLGWTGVLLAMFTIFSTGCGGEGVTAPPPEDTVCPVYPDGPARVISGAFSTTITFPGHPFPVFWPTVGGNPATTGPCRYSKTFNVPLSGTFKGAWVFFGVDRGGIVESHVIVQDQSGRILLERSEHKETLSHYDAFRHYEFTPPVTFTSVNIQILAYVTEPSNRTNVHWEVAFERQ